MKLIFESNLYQPIMFILIAVVSLLILFSFVNIFNNLPQPKNNKSDKSEYVSENYIITSLSIYNKNNKSIKDLPYSKKGYYFYFMIFKILTFLIIIVGMKLASPIIKKWT